MSEERGLGELPAMARLAIDHADGSTQGEADAERIDTEIDRLALANGYTVDQVCAPLFAGQNDRPEPAAA